MKTALESVLSATIPPAPCDYCMNAAECATGKACVNFARYCGFVGGRVLWFRKYPDVPSTIIYEELFNDTD